MSLQLVQELDSLYLIYSASVKRDRELYSFSGLKLDLIGDWLVSKSRDIGVEVLRI